MARSRLDAFDARHSLNGGGPWTNGTNGTNVRLLRGAIISAMHPTIERLDALVLDLDGVLYRGNQTVPGAPEAIERLRAAGKRVLFLTNNATRTESEVIAKLQRHGVDATPDEILTSARVTTDLLLERDLGGSTVYLIGGNGIRSALEEAGFVLLDGDDASNAEIVVIGSDRSFDWDAMRIASEAVRRGARFIATNSDPTLPTPDGLVPGAGAIIAAVEVASGRTAEVVGKPELPMMRAAAARLPGATAIGIVGDQPITDLDGGRAMGWTTILVLSGVVGAEQVEKLEPQPDVVVADLAALTA